MQKNRRKDTNGTMKIRVKDYSDRNLIGRRVETLRKARGIKQKDFIARLQVAGLDINPTSYSKLEGQTRVATDKEVLIIAQVLGVPMEELFKDDDTEDTK
jgi:transcriptional regulator with XRE-family HTH domain